MYKIFVFDKDWKLYAYVSHLRKKERMFIKQCLEQGKGIRITKRGVIVYQRGTDIEIGNDL